jgi:iron(III) transport system ATP-binding protein
MAHVVLSNITKRFGDVVAVDRLNLDVEKGECVAMLGPSGCGKTTTLRMVAGFDDIDEGEIRVADRVLSSRQRNYYLPPENRNFGMVFQAFAVWPHLTIFENVAFPLRVRKLPAAEIDRRTREALQHTNLLDVAASRPDDLSGGGKQRVALARALAIQPDVMLLDEPLSSLDPHFREEMRFEIKDLQRRFDFSIIYVTHDQSEAMALSDRILVMKAGVVQQIGTPVEVYGAPANRFVFGFIGLSNFLATHVGADGMRVGASAVPWPDGHKPPAELLRAGEAVAATRPTEIDFAPQGIRGVVTRRSYLGEMVDYQVDVAGQVLRVQKTRHESGPQVGESCALRFAKVLWYPADSVA